MATHNYTFTPAFSHGFADAISGASYRAMAAVSNWNEARLTRKALSALSDHMLEDIGLTRGDIADIR